MARSNIWENARRLISWKELKIEEYSSDGFGLTLTFFMARSNLLSDAFTLENA